MGGEGDPGGPLDLYPLYAPTKMSRALVVLLFLLGLWLHTHEAALGPRDLSFSCDRWNYNGSVYAFSSLDKVWELSGPDVITQLSLCRPLPQDRLSPPTMNNQLETKSIPGTNNETAGASPSGLTSTNDSDSSPAPMARCPPDSRICLWHKDMKGVVGSLGPVSAAFTNSKGHVILTFASGTEDPLTGFPMMRRIVLICDEKRTEETGPMAPSLQAGMFTYHWISRHACPIVQRTPGGGNGGGGGHPGDAKEAGWSMFSTFILLVLIGFGAYMAAGFIWKRMVLGIPGAEAIPHLDFWCDLRDTIRSKIRPETTNYENV